MRSQHLSEITSIISESLEKGLYQLQSFSLSSAAPTYHPAAQVPLGEGRLTTAERGSCENTFVLCQISCLLMLVKLLVFNLLKQGLIPCRARKHGLLPNSVICDTLYTQAISSPTSPTSSWNLRVSQTCPLLPYGIDQWKERRFWKRRPCASSLL